jgi:pimeloyl-ACP methyl ester carboxylesterase
MRLASTASSPNRPTCILVHGLDSSKDTWSDVLSRLMSAGYPAIAIDLRGHGETPLGPPAEFSANQLAADVLAAAREVSPCGAVLLGHSMGGRVATCAAALDAAHPTPVLRSVIIEDMDVAPRGLSFLGELDEERTAVLARFGQPDGRRFDSWADVRAALLTWYGDGGRVDSWRGSRVREMPDGSWWSDLNPQAQRLAAEKVLATRH